MLKILLGVFLRQSAYWEDGNSTIESLFTGIFLQLAELEEPKKISGRLYITTGLMTDKYMPTFFKVVGIGLTTDSFKLSGKWSFFLQSDNIKHPALEETIEGLQSLKDIDDSEIIPLVSHQFDIDEKESQRRKDLFVKSMNAIIHDLEDHRKLSIINAPIDEKRLLDFGVNASTSTFTLDNGPMPVSHFSMILNISMISNLKC